MTNKSFIILFLVMIQFTARAQQTYQLDIKKSKILWDNRKTMGGHHGYMFLNSGSLSLSPGEEIGSGSFSINMNSMTATDGDDAHNAAVKKKLRADTYFDMDKYPEAIVNIKQMIRVGRSSSYNITGDLKIKGITNPVKFTANLVPKNGYRLTATATTTIDRLKWHIDMQAPNKPWDMFGAIQNKVTPDEILITLELEFVKAE